MPLKQQANEYSPQITQQRKCPKHADAHHLQVVATLLYLDAQGLDPVNVSMGCGCKLKMTDIPNQRRGAARAHARHREKPKAAQVQDRVEGLSAAEKRRRFDEAQLALFVPKGRRRAGEP